MHHSKESLFTAILLLCFGAAILFLKFQDKLGFYVYPTHIPYISISASIILLTGIFLLFSRKKIHLHIENRFLLPLLLLPILFIIFVPAKPLSSDTALARGIVEELPIFASDTSFSFNVDPKNRQLLDWIKAFNADPEPNNYIGQEVHIKGFITPSEEPHLFFLTQFYIACCAADARPIAIPVEYSGDFSPKKDAWIDLEGTMKAGEIKGERKVIIDMKKATPIEIPSNPYAF